MNLKLVGLMALCGAAIIACGDSSNSGGSGGSGASSNGGNSDGGTTNVGGNSDGGTINIGGQGTGGGTTEPVCYAEGDAQELQAPGPTVVTGQNVCTAAQIDGFYPACFGGDTAACDAWVADNGPCGGCFFGVDDLSLPTDQQTVTGNFPVLLNGTVYSFLQIGACEAAAQSLPQCTLPVSNLYLCAGTACEANCDNSTAPPNEFSDCEDYAVSEGICADIVIEDACMNVLNPATSSPECDGASFEEAFVNVANFFCGP